MVAATAKETARQTLEHLPDQASWNEILYALYVKQKVETGLQAAKDGRTVSHAEAKRRLIGVG